MFTSFKRESLRKLRMAEDKSPKGSIDEPIVDLIRLINDHPNYVTSSSCSGRIAVFCGVPAASADADAAAATSTESANLITKGGKWLLAEHATITTEQLLRALRSPDALATTNSNMLIFKHEPFIMHVACRDLDAAKELLQWGLACGFRESGVVLGNKKVMCAIRTSANGLEIPIARTATELFVSDEYLAWIVQVANEKFAANKKKTDQLLEAFKKTFGQSQAGSAESVASVALAQVRELASDAVKRTGHSSVVHGTNIVVFGGQGPTPSGTTTRLAALQILSVADDNMLQVVFDDAENVAAPSARMQHSAVVIGDDMVVFGGRAGPTKPLNDIYTFNMRTKMWTHVGTVGEPPAPRYKHSSCVVGSTMFVFGGRDATTVFSDMYALNLAQSTPVWRRIDMPFAFPRFDHVSAVVEQTKLLFWGGMASLHSAADDDAEDAGNGANNETPADCLLYDTATKSWERRAIRNAGDGPDAALIAASACHVSDRHVVVTGGMTPATLVNGSNATQKLFALDVQTMTWQRLGDVANERAAFAAHTCVWLAHRSSVVLLGGGFQCFGFGQFYSAPFECKLALSTITPATKVAVQPAASSSAAADSDRSSSARPQAPAKAATDSMDDDGELLGVLAAKLDVKTVKTLLETRGVYDKSRRVHVVQRESSGSAFLIPVTHAFRTAALTCDALRALEVVRDDDAYANKFGKRSGLNRNDVIQSTILALAAKHGVSAAAQARVPDKYEFVADVLLVPRDAFSEPEWQRVPALWATVCAATTPPFSRVARKAFIDTSEKRQSRVDLLYVNAAVLPSRDAPGWVEVRENGIIYGWDLTRVMFSSGNVTEKARMARIGCRDEVIVDLFCGIGYYVLPFLVHGGAAFVHACEWNPDSVAALRFNLERNRVAHKCQVYLGDNRETAPKLANVADRVNLGLLPTSVKAWPLAVQVLKPQGGWLHVHDNVAVEDRDAWEQRLVATLQSLAQECGKRWRISCAHVERVKSYAPKVHHLVADIHCEPFSE